MLKQLIVLCVLVVSFAAAASALRVAHMSRSAGWPQTGAAVLMANVQTG